MSKVRGPQSYSQDFLDLQTDEVYELLMGVARPKNSAPKSQTPIFPPTQPKVPRLNFGFGVHNLPRRLLVRSVLNDVQKEAVYVNSELKRALTGCVLWLILLGLCAFCTVYIVPLMLPGPVGK